MNDFAVSVQASDGNALVRVEGEVDLLTAPNVEDAIRKCVDEGSVLVVVDMSATTFMSCAGINAVIAARTHGLRVGSTVGIVRASRPVARLLDVAHATALLLDAAPPVTSKGASREVTASIPAPHAAIAALSDALERVEQLEEALESRGIIGCAKGILMERFNVSDDIAFAVLKRSSSQLELPLRAVAAQVVETRQLPPELTTAQDKPSTAS